MAYMWLLGIASEVLEVIVPIACKCWRPFVVLDDQGMLHDGGYDQSMIRYNNPPGSYYIWLDYISSKHSGGLNIRNYFSDTGALEMFYNKGTSCNSDAFRCKFGC